MVAWWNWGRVLFLFSFYHFFLLNLMNANNSTKYITSMKFGRCSRQADPCLVRVALNHYTAFNVITLLKCEKNRIRWCGQQKHWLQIKKPYKHAHHFHFKRAAFLWIYSMHYAISRSNARVREPMSSTAFKWK